MWMSRYFVWFLVFSFLGWIYETLYVSIKEKRWANRGFLFGPVCPIYGVGAVTICAVVENVPAAGGSYAWWQIFLISFFGSIVLEYGTHWTLEKLFHACWWDYSNMPLNIHGRICLPASLAFGAAGVLVVKVLYPLADRLTGGLSPAMLEFLSLLGMAVIAADTTLTVSALTNFSRIVRSTEDMINIHMQAYVETFTETAGAAMQRASERASEERRRFSDSTVSYVTEHMGRHVSGAVRRVKKLRPSGRLAAPAVFAGAQQLLAGVKDRVASGVKRSAKAAHDLLTESRESELQRLSDETPAAPPAASAEDGHPAEPAARTESEPPQSPDGGRTGASPDHAGETASGK